MKGEGRRSSLFLQLIRKLFKPFQLNNQTARLHMYYLSIGHGESIIQITHPDEILNCHEASVAAPLPRASTALHDL